MEQQEYVEVQEEIVTPDTTYMCGACYEWFPYIEDFNAHKCTADNAENPSNQEVENQEECRVIQEDGDLEKDVANILGEMKYTIPSRTAFQGVAAEHIIHEGESHDQSYIITYEQDGIPSYVPHREETTIEVHADPVGESVEIPSSCLYPYENPVYLNRLMKDNTVGKRLRHDAPYTHRLGPWDNTSTKLLIDYVKKIPTAYFIAADNIKRTEAWEQIRSRLSEADYHFTVLQIRMRWRELCKKYRNVVNYNELHGTKRTCQFFNELNELFGTWDRKATEILINELSSKDIKQNGGTRMRYNTWDKIRKVLFNNGYNYTAHQVHGRWNALVTLYQRMVDRNSNPDAEPFDMAYKDLMEPVFPYVAKPTQAKGSKDSKDKWTLSAERALLQAYTDNIENFRKNESKNNRDVWHLIVEFLQKECGYSTTVEKARTRFYELAKYYGTMLRYNSQPGALHRESKHNEILASIYNRYNLWPHDGSVIKLDNLNARRMRQLNAQLRWTEDESRVILQLYPQVLTDHLQASEQQPLEELWVQMAKTLMQIKNISKRPYEIEEHIVLLRRGFKSDNPFPFRAEMEELEETEHSLCFSPNESPSTDAVQMVPYWSHSAANTLLNYVIHYRQEGVKTLNDNMYEVISIDLESHGYSYTGKECRQYYQLLRKMFNNKLQAGEEQKDNSCSFPYWERMLELRSVSQFDYEDTEEVRLKILEAASSKLEKILGGEDSTRQQNMERNLCQLKIYMMNFSEIRPPPPIKYIANVLLMFMRNEEVVTTVDTHTYFVKLRNMLHQHMDVLAIVAERGALRNLEKLQMEGKKRQLSRGQKIRSMTVQWNDENIQSMLSTVKEWQQLCHDEDELTTILCRGQPLWDEVAYKLSRRFKKCPNLCKEFFDELCERFIKEELVSVATEEGTKTPHKDESPISAVNKSTLRSILSPLVSHDAEWDPRDVWWAAEAEGWSREETLELLFTVRELLNEEDSVDWDQVTLMMVAGGYQHSADRYQSKFIDLYNGYKRAYTFNKDCLIRDRRRPPFYFKIHSLFGFKESIQRCYSAKWEAEADYPDEDEVVEVLLVGLKERKNLSCHMVPRMPLLNLLVTYMQEQYDEKLSFYPNQVWKLLVQLHKAQAEVYAAESGGPFGRNLDGLWENHSNPLLAYGFQAIPTSGWQWVKNWSLEELSILTDDVIKQCANVIPKNKESTKIPNIFLYQLGYMLSTYKHGGYLVYGNQLNLMYMLLRISTTDQQLNNAILLKLRDNYRNIEESKAILRSIHSGKSIESKFVDIDDLSELSEDSEGKDFFSDSDVEEESELTDTDEENLQVSNHTSHPQYKVRGSAIPEQNNISLNSSYSEQSNVTEHGGDDVKYFFKMKTHTFSNKKGSNACSVGNPNIQVVTNPDQENGEKSVTSVWSGSTNIQIVTNADLEKKDKDAVQIVTNADLEKKDKGAVQIVTNADLEKKDKGAVSNSVPKTSPDSVGVTNKRKNSDGEELQLKKIRVFPQTSSAARSFPQTSRAARIFPQTSSTGRIYNEGQVSTLPKKSPETKCTQNSVVKPTLSPGNSVEKEVDRLQDSSKKNKRKLLSPQKWEQSQTIRSTNSENDDRKEKAEAKDAKSIEPDKEGKAAIMELSESYYQRRIREKDRLLTAFNAIQESHQEQASAILLMFDTLQSML